MKDQEGSIKKYLAPIIKALVYKAVEMGLQ